MSSLGPYLPLGGPPLGFFRIDCEEGRCSALFREGRLTADGFHATFDANDESLESLARFVGKESACCSSFTFELTYEPPYDEVELAITGPDGTRDLIEQGFVERFDRIDADTDRT